MFFAFEKPQKFEFKTPEDLTSFQRFWLMFKPTIPLHIWSAFWILGCLLMPDADNKLSGSIAVFVIFVVPAEFFALRRWAWSPAKKHDYLISKLVKRALRWSAYSFEERRKLRFAYDPLYRARITKRVHSDAEMIYQADLKQRKKEIERLTKQRKKEIERLEKERWTYFAKRVGFSTYEGKISFNGEEFTFDKIGSYRIVSQESTRTEFTQTATTKSKPSIGGAVVGGALFGGAGAVIGGLGCSKSKTVTKITSKEIPVCTYLAVEARFGRVDRRVVLINGQVDKNSFVYTKAYSEAQSIITTLDKCSSLPVPKECIRVEALPSVVEFDERILHAMQELEDAQNRSIDYSIPQEYLLGDDIVCDIPQLTGSIEDHPLESGEKTCQADVDDMPCDDSAVTEDCDIDASEDRD